jgi:hypothetical protein
MMRWLLRPWLFLTLSAAVVIGAVLLTWAWGVFDVRAGPVPVVPGDREIVWLYPATNPAAWERFIAALRRAGERLPGLQADIGPSTFPRNTTAPPEAALVLPGGRGRLVFRWYKLTSEWKARDWINALLTRNPPPLAIIGGSSSDTARDLAIILRQLTSSVPENKRPLLLLTTATADRVVAEGINTSVPRDGDPEIEPTLGISLGLLYPGRTFRFSFSNRQMAAAVTRFIWSQEDLRPDRDPAYMVRWEDDSYSRDLVDGFGDSLVSLMAAKACRQWGWITGAVCGCGPLFPGGGPIPSDSIGLEASGFCLSEGAPISAVDSSVGSFDRPNRFESQVARELLDEYRKPRTGGQQPPARPLLMVTGQSQPCRRFLRALLRSNPDLARHFVVATGDALAFNTIYRDRQEAWPIQDLPYPLVFFCHHNPIDRDAGFRPDGEGDLAATTGTEEVLLDQDIIESLTWAATAEGVEGVRARLQNVRLGDDGHVSPSGEGTRLFGSHGGRRTGTGEHVVCLRPRMVPGEPAKATIEVWAWRAEVAADGETRAGNTWRRVGAAITESVAPAVDTWAAVARAQSHQMLATGPVPYLLSVAEATITRRAGEPLEVLYETDPSLGDPGHGN